jgi:hypothetical protein
VVGPGVQTVDRSARSQADLARGVDQLAVRLEVARVAVGARRRDREVEREDPDEWRGCLKAFEHRWETEQRKCQPGEGETCRGLVLNLNRESVIRKYRGRAQDVSRITKTLQERDSTA